MNQIITDIKALQEETIIKPSKFKSKQYSKSV